MKNYRYVGFLLLVWDIHRLECTDDKQAVRQI